MTLYSRQKPPEILSLFQTATKICDLFQTIFQWLGITFSKKSWKPENSSLKASFRHVILRFDVCLQQLSILGKDFKWTKPSTCPGCKKSSLWGHGFVLKAFAGFLKKLWLKRYRCPGCRIVLTLHPKGFWQKFQSCIQDIYQVLHHRLTRFHWPKGYPRQRAGHWLRSFISFLMMLNGQNLLPWSLAEHLGDFYQRQIEFCGK